MAVETAIEPSRSWVHAQTWLDAGMLGLTVGTTETESSVTIVAANGESGPSPFSWLPALTKSPYSRTPARDLGMIQAWLDDCQENHPDCQQFINEALPTRVIDVGDEGKDPFLFHSQGRSGRYMALSHRWGDPDSQIVKLVTTKDNISQHCRGIPLASFPATFRDAVMVTRRLGVRYIWIDSLCIVQDDLDDWSTESIKMGDVYENAYGTLFAERAKNCTDGLAATAADLNIARQRFRMFQFHDSSRGTTHEIFLSTKLTAYPNSLSAAFCLFGEARSMLQTRGWVLQEEILSRRKICFSSTELHWQCNQVNRCECGLHATLRSSDHSVLDFNARLLYPIDLEGKVSKRRLSSRQSTRTHSAVDHGKAWRKLVEAFTNRALTFDQDRLAALAGIVSRTAKNNEGASPKYISGLWLDDIVAQLLWQSSYHPDALPCRRQRPGFAPSFSWASVTGSVTFSIPRLWETPHSDTLMEVVSPLSIGTPNIINGLKIKGKAINVEVFRRKTEEKNPPFRYTHLKLKDGTKYEVGFQIPGLETSVPFQHLRLDTLEDWDYFDKDQSHDFVFLITHVIKEAWGMSSFPVGLILRGVGGDRYERLCMVTGHLRQLRWESISRFDVVYGTELVLV